jgi:hypothetical protein
MKGRIGLLSVVLAALGLGGIGLASLAIRDAGETTATIGVPPPDTAISASVPPSARLPSPPNAPPSALPPPAPPPPPPDQAEARDVRTITAPGITPPPRVSGPLERVAGREPEAKPAAPAKPRLLRPVVVEDPRSFRSGDLLVTLPGIVAVAPDERCKDDQGRPWACGTAAMLAVRAYVRGKGLQCVIPADARDGSFETACKLGAVDLAEWLVRQGWARPAAPDDRLAKAEAAAREGKLGQWRNTAPEPARLEP